MKRQEMFEFIARHLFDQGDRAMGYSEIYGVDVCMYRGRGGTTCAVGCLIPDRFYKENMEGKSITNLIEEKREGLGFLNRHESFLYGMQAVHDEPIFWRYTERMRKALRDVAKEYNLKSDFLNELSFKNK